MRLQPILTGLGSKGGRTFSTAFTSENFDPKAALRSSTYETWGTAISRSGQAYAWPREVLSSRFAKLSVDTIVTGDTDDLLYLDNDVVFLDDVCKAHDVFETMSNTSIFGMAPQMSDLYTRAQAPFAFPVEASMRWMDQPGINSGVIFWKLGRARMNCWSQPTEECRIATSASAVGNSQNDSTKQHWLQYLEQGMDSFKFGLLDQDIFNYIAWMHPSLLEVSPTVIQV